MGSGTQTSQTVASSDPWKPAQGLLRQGMSDALRAYRQGYGSNVYTGSTVVPFSEQTSQAYGNLSRTAQRNMGNNGLQGNLQGIINRGGFSQEQAGAMNNMQRQLGQLGANGLSNAQDAAMRNYSDLANSEYDFNANPGAQGVLNKAIRDTSNAVNLNAASAGRYGSGTHEGVLGRTIGDLSSDFRYNDYNNWLGRRDAANAGMATLGQQGVQNRQGLSSSIFNAGQAGLGNMTQAYQGMQAPAQTLSGVGSAYEDLYGRQLQDKLRIFDAQNNAPWNQIGRLMQVGNMGGQYQTTNTTAQTPGPNPFLQTLGGVTTGVGLLGGLGIL